jgi:hypothetical protein
MNRYARHLVFIVGVFSRLRVPVHGALLFLLVLLFLTKENAAAAATPPAQPFVSSTQTLGLAAAHSVVLTEIGWMLLTPKMIRDDDWKRASKTLSKADASQFVKLVGAMNATTTLPTTLPSALPTTLVPLPTGAPPQPAGGTSPPSTQKPATKCKFAPGFQVTFLDEKQQVIDAFLVCLNCNVLAVGDRQPTAMRPPLKRSTLTPARYGQALEQRAELIALLKPYTAINLR